MPALPTNTPINLLLGVVTSKEVRGFFKKVKDSSKAAVKEWRKD